MASNLDDLLSAVRSLSSEGGVVLRTGERPDALAFEFDEQYTTYMESLIDLPTEAQLRSLQALDSGIQELSDPEDAVLWNARAFDSHPRWIELRTLADTVLHEFSEGVQP